MPLLLSLFKESTFSENSLLDKLSFLFTKEKTYLKEKVTDLNIHYEKSSRKVQGPFIQLDDSVQRKFSVNSDSRSGGSLRKCGSDETLVDKSTLKKCFSTMKRRKGKPLVEINETVCGCGCACVQSS